ncbi:MAG: HAD-IA family hydrolase [Candidatus Rokubacteria bacterium]|nr:HAD-IA family hydrolase [Candidatus Rokubacteria bacterium]
MTIPEITVDQLIARYAVLLLDAYGVLVDSGGPLPGAAGFIARLNETATPYYIVSNDASRLPETAARRYRGFGLALDAERFLTSGMLLTDWFAREDLRGAPCVVLGPPDSTTYVERAGGRAVSPDEPFEAVVICDESGFPFLDVVDAVLSALVRALDAGRRLRLVCANPDLVYPRPGGFGIASGSIALVLEAALDLRYPGHAPRFQRLGKPFPGLFDAALARSGTRDMVMVGDQLETDIQGARRFGLDAVLVSTGVSDGLGTLPPALHPTWRLRSFA